MIGLQNMLFIRTCWVRLVFQLLNWVFYQLFEDRILPRVRAGLAIDQQDALDFLLDIFIQVESCCAVSLLAKSPVHALLLEIWLLICL